MRIGASNNKERACIIRARMSIRHHTEGTVAVESREKNILAHLPHPSHSAMAAGGDSQFDGDDAVPAPMTFFYW